MHAGAKYLKKFEQETSSHVVFGEKQGSYNREKYLRWRHAVAKGSLHSRIKIRAERLS